MYFLRAISFELVRYTVSLHVEPQMSSVGSCFEPLGPAVWGGSADLKAIVYWREVLRDMDIPVSCLTAS